MGKFIHVFLVLALNFIFASQAFALRADFESVRKFHDKEVDQLLKDYTLEQSLTIRMELKRKDQELKDQKIVDIPGLYQKTGEVDDRGLENILNLYERRVVIIKKREVSEKEIDLVKQALMERLFLPKETTFTTLDNIPTLDSAIKNLKSDFLFGAYETLIKGGQFLWIIIFSIGFISAMWFLARVWKSKSSGGEAGSGGSGGAGIGGSGESYGNSENTIQADDLGFEKDLNVASKNSKAFEILNFESLCQNLYDCYEAVPGSTSYRMWLQFPDLKSQIQFYEIIRIQNQVSIDLREKCFKVLDDVFSFKKRAAKNLTAKNEKIITEEDLSNLSIDLARLKFIEPNKLLEKCYKEIYPAKADYADLMLENSYSNHYFVLYKMFKEVFINYISKIEDETVIQKINELITFDPDKDHPSDDLYNNFINYSKNLNFEDLISSKESKLNPKMIQMIYKMSEIDLAKIELLNSNEYLRAQIPTFDWIKMDDMKLFKDFLSNLSGVEIRYLIEYNTKFSELMNKLDERALFRFNERVKTEAHLELKWKVFRDKIKKYYTYNSVGSNDDQNKKAS